MAIPYIAPADITRISRAVRWVESQKGFAPLPSPRRQHTQPQQEPWQCYIYTDDNGVFRLQCNGGERLVIGSGQPEHLGGPWTFDLLGELGYVYMRYQYSVGWQDSQPQYSASLPNDDGSTRTVLIARIEYDSSRGYRVRQARKTVETYSQSTGLRSVYLRTLEDGYQVRQARNIIEVQSLIDDESSSSESEESSPSSVSSQSTSSSGSSSLSVSLSESSPSSQYNSSQSSESTTPPSSNESSPSSGPSSESSLGESDSSYSYQESDWPQESISESND